MQTALRDASFRDEGRLDLIPRFPSFVKLAKISPRFPYQIEKS